jgi:hypothetical protein
VASAHYITAMNNELISETPASGLFDPAVMERLVAETQRGCWFWLDWEIALMYRDWPSSRISEGSLVPQPRNSHVANAE